jgi:hypothetical protein
MLDIIRKTIHNGLDQIPTDGLLRLIEWINAGKPVLLTGQITCTKANGEKLF